MQWCIEQTTEGLGRKETTVLAYHNDSDKLRQVVDYIRQAYAADEPWRIAAQSMMSFRATWKSENATINVTVKVTRVTGEIVHTLPARNA